MKLEQIVIAATIMAAVGGLAILGQPSLTWLVRGEAVVACPCKVPCPCRSNAPPSQPHCENLSYVRIVEGRYAATRLDGMEFVWAADECTGKNRQAKPTTFYFRRGATQNEVAAVENIMDGEHCASGKHSAARVRRVNLSAGSTRSIYSVRVPSLLQLDVDLAPGPIPMEPLPALDSWSNTVSYARNIRAWIDDTNAGLKWDYSGLQANYRTFEVSSDLFERGLMLALYRDDTGRFNEMHRNLIGELHLEVPLTRDEFQSMLAQVQAPAAAVPDKPGKDPSGSVGGLVYGADGQLRSGARVRLTAAGAVAAPVAVANAAGAYFVARIEPGVYQECGFSWDGKIAEKACEPITIKPGQVARRNLKLAAAGGS